jgi:hypothetical protein
MNGIVRKLIVGAALSAALGAGCSQDHGLSPAYSPRDPRGGAKTPPVPSNVTALVGNRSVTLSWGLPDSSLASSVRIYRIYKQTASDETPTIADSSGTSPKSVIDLSNGRAVRLSISAVLTNGLEGKRSADVEVLPALLSLTIQEGKAVTRSREVIVGISVPGGASTVTLGEQPDLGDGITRSYAASMTWTLSDGDGSKTVYGRISDALGNPSEIVSGTIRLDTKAEIISLDYDGSDTRAPGDAIIFRMRAGEPFGTAELEIPRDGSLRVMRDDGLAPDQTAGDGVYTLEYIAETNRQFIGGEVVGQFRDEAGNSAPERPAPRRLTVHAAPPALTLFPLSSGDPQEISLQWTRAPEGTPFGNYRIFRDVVPGVAQSTSRRLIEDIGNVEIITHTDETVEPGRTYYYIVEMVDPLGTATPSNEVSGASKHNDPPTAVVLAAPYGITESSVSLVWSRNEEDDFRLYRVLRAEHPNVATDPTRRSLTEIADRTSVRYVDDTELEEGGTYYYVIETVDELGLETVSNERSATLDDRYPAAVVLAAPDSAGQTTVDLTWTENTDRDFDSYRLYRSGSAGVDETDALVVSIAESERTRWMDGTLTRGTDYYYRIFVRDKGGHLTPSNEIKVTTASE